MRNVAERAKYNEEQIEKILDQYITFVEKFQRLTVAGSEYDEIVNRFEHILFQTHICSSGCDKKCTKKGKVLQPRKPKVFKLLHLFLKESSLYKGLENFLALFLRCLVKTHAEGVAESMGNYLEMHCDKRRGRMDIDDFGIEAFIHWNGPPLHLSEKLGIKSLDRHFRGRGRWNFVTRANKTDSSVVKRLKNVEAKIPFFM